jgi:hypothetical protein
MESIFMITLLGKKNKTYNNKGLITNLKNEAIYKRDKLIIGIFEDKKTAKEVILSNDTDIAEDGYYQYAVIEEVGFGVYGLSGEQKKIKDRMENLDWYRWHKEEKQYNRIPKCPEDLNNLISFYR